LIINNSCLSHLRYERKAVVHLRKQKCVLVPSHNWYFRNWSLCRHWISQLKLTLTHLLNNIPDVLLKLCHYLRECISQPHQVLWSLNRKLKVSICTTEYKLILQSISFRMFSDIVYIYLKWEIKVYCNIYLILLCNLNEVPRLILVFLAVKERKIRKYIYANNLCLGFSITFGFYFS